MATPPPRRQVGLGQAVDEYADHLAGRVARGHLAAGSRDAYLRDLAELVQLIGDAVPLDDIQTSDLLDVLTRLAAAPDRRYSRASKPPVRGRPAQGRGAHSRARFVATAAGLFRWAAVNGLVTYDPMADRSLFHVAVPRRASGARLGLEEAEAARLLHAPLAAPAADGNGKRALLPPRDVAILALLAVCGLRVSELTTCDVDDLRTAHGKAAGATPALLRVIGKGDKERLVPVPPLVLDHVKAWIGGERARLMALARGGPDDAQALFVSINGRRLSARDVQRMVKRHARAGNMPLGRDVTPHALRHTALTLLALDGVDVVTLAALAGHTDIATTSVYLDADAAKVAQAVAGHPLLSDRSGA